jgi:MFS family permease
MPRPSFRRSPGSAGPGRNEGPARPLDGRALSPLTSLRFARFRVLMLVQVGNAVAVWVHVVAAQWILTDEGRSATAIAAVPAALSVPFFLLCLPFGALAGTWSPVRMMTSAILVSTFASCCAAALAAARPQSATLLVLTVIAIGTGLVGLAIAWQSMIPDLVGREAAGSAALVDGASFNAARALGPIAGGLGLFLVGPVATFAATAALFAVCAAAVACLTPRRAAAPTAREPLMKSIRGGLRFTRHSRWTRRLLLRLVLFGLPSSALWALLPLVAHQRLGLGSGGFGLLFGMVGVGAVLGITALAPIRARLSVNAFAFWGSLAFAGMLLGLATATDRWVVAALLALGGAAWVGVQTTWMTAAHQTLPDWVRPRIIALILLLFQGAQAVGAMVWGSVADRVGLSGALIAAAAVMAGSALGFVRHGLYPSAGIEPLLALTAEPARRPDLDPRQEIRVEVTYLPRAGQAAEFRAAVGQLRLSRLRLGAQCWELLVDPAEPGMYVESFAVASWADHVAAETERLTVPEQRLRDRVRSVLEREPQTRILLRETSVDGPMTNRGRERRSGEGRAG